jgi:hypothetical protein
LRWGLGECFGKGFCNVRLAGPPEELVVIQVPLVGDGLEVAFGGVDEFDQVAVVIGQSCMHDCCVPSIYTPMWQVARAQIC